MQIGPQETLLPLPLRYRYRTLCTLLSPYARLSRGRNIYAPLNKPHVLYGNLVFQYSLLTERDNLLLRDAVEDPLWTDDVADVFVHDELQVICFRETLVSFAYHL